MINELWQGRRYYSLGSYLKNTYGEKMYKLPLSIATTCPNRDGRVGVGGCIFCSHAGSGDYAGDVSKPIPEQIKQSKDLVGAGFTDGKYIAYFQSFTSTYVPFEKMERYFREAIEQPEVAILSVATRPDCLGMDVLTLLEELNKIKPVWVELGLQTCKESTAGLINRCYDNRVYETAMAELLGRNIEVITHVILGLPGETGEDMLNTVRYVAEQGSKGIKLQLLHVLKDTPLLGMFNRGELHVLTEEEYVEITAKCLEILPPDMVIHRLTGDGPADILVAPKWSSHKRMVLNHIHKYLKDHDTWQGRLYNA